MICQEDDILTQQPYTWIHRQFVSSTISSIIVHYLLLEILENMYSLR